MSREAERHSFAIDHTLCMNRKGYPLESETSENARSSKTVFIRCVLPHRLLPDYMSLSTCKRVIRALRHAAQKCSLVYELAA